MERAGKSLLRSSGLEAAADNLRRRQKLHAATGQRAALAGAFSEKLLKRHHCAVQLGMSAISQKRTNAPQQGMCALRTAPFLSPSKFGARGWFKQKGH